MRVSRLSPAGTVNVKIVKAPHGNYGLSGDMMACLVIMMSVCKVPSVTSSVAHVSCHLVT